MRAQEAIFDEAGGEHQFLEYSARAPGDVDALRAAVRAARDGAGAPIVLAFGDRLWRRLAPDAVPAQLRPLADLAPDLPATQADLLVWVHGERRDLVFDAALRAHRALDAAFSLAAEVSAFRFLDSRDLTGFVDGSANPQADERREVALVPEGQVGAGGSYVLAQRWVHDLPRFHALSEPEQENVIGRTKPDSVEFDDERMPADAHVARTDIGLPLYRRSMPYGSIAEHGLYFFAFAAELERFETILKHMFGQADDGVRDRLTRFSRPVSGSFFFAPSQDALDGI